MTVLSATVTDRTSEPWPLVVTGEGLVMKGMLVDNNPTRPAVVVVDSKFVCPEIARGPNDGYVPVESDPGLGYVYNGEVAPKTAIGFSHHDNARAAVAAHGDCTVDLGKVKSTVGVNLTAALDGRNGEGSKVVVGRSDCSRFGVLASGQKGLCCSVESAYISLWPDPSYVGAGHVFYANESRMGATYLRLVGAKVRIGKVRSVERAVGVRVDHVTAKFKGSWDVDYRCLDDKNACGALDAPESCGRALVKWAHPGGTAQNHAFLSFRMADRTGFGLPPSNFILDGEFDWSKAPDQTVRGFAMHMLERPQYAYFGKVLVRGQAPGDAYSGCVTRGLGNIPVI